MRRIIAGLSGIVLMVAITGCDSGEDRSRDEAAPPVTVTSQAPAAEGAYGSDPALDALYDRCEGGEDFACDQLWVSSPSGSEYEEFAGNCGGRGVPEGQFFCEVSTDEPTETGASAAYGSDPALDALYDDCAGGNMTACDDLFWQSPLNSEYEDFGRNCGSAGKPDNQWNCDPEYSLTGMGG